jgi:AAHS family 4-hydroxybenzoate transporter-like MFS transporter
MADKVVPVSRLLDERGLGSFQIKLIIWSFFIVLVDGYDIAAIAFAAPSLVARPGVQRKSHRHSVWFGIVWLGR